MRPAYLTAGQPGIGGRLKVKPEDFFVEEIPLYPPAGAGQHVYAVIEKRRNPRPNNARASIDLPAISPQTVISVPAKSADRARSRRRRSTG